MIDFRGVHKVFEGQGRDTVALRDFCLTVPRGETHCLIGTSGCGKTTSLRMVNRLETPTSGTITIDEQDVARCDVIALRRRIGYVIQTGGLFPHMTVARNIGMLCELENWTQDATRERVHALLELVQLPPTDYADRYPGELSGGQRQRIGIARALALDPDYVLMDEPFGALDPITRADVHRELKPLFESDNRTVLFVTHDLREAFALADRVSIVHEGRCVQSGTEAELMSDPENEFVARFLAAHASSEPR